MSKLTASVIIPMHNAEDHVARMIGCLQAQTHHEFEVLMVDDGSTDATVATSLRLTAEDPRFTVLQQPKQAGPGVARNAGMEQACGDYLFFFDVDDIVAPVVLDHALTKAEQTNADIVIFQMDHIDVRDGLRYPSPDMWDAQRYPATFNPADYAENLFGDFRNWPVDKAFRRTYIEHAEIRFPALYRTEDLAFTCAALARAEKIALLNEVLYTYRIGAEAASTQTRDNAPADFFESAKALKAYLGDHDLMGVYRPTYTKWVALACCVNLLELSTYKGYQRAYDALHDGGLVQLELDKTSRDRWTTYSENDTTRAAGDIENADIWCMLDIIERCEIAEGTFHLLSLREQIHERHWAHEVEHVRDSYSFKVGNALLTPIHLVRDRFGAGR